MKFPPAAIAISSALLLGCSGLNREELEWIPTGGPRAQNVTAILVDEKNPGRVFASLLDGDVYASGDNGRTWKNLSTIRPWNRVYQMTQDPENDEILYAATEAGLFCSRDRGQTWTLLPRENGSSAACRSLAIDPWNHSTMYLGTRTDGIYRSTDGGTTWQARNREVDSAPATAEVFDLKVDPGNPDAIVAAIGGAGIVRSTDAGATWERLTREFSHLSSTTTHVAVHRKSGTTIVYATDAGTIARTTTGGETWTITKRDDAARRVLTLSTDPNNPENLFAGTENGIVRSTDFGSNWIDVPLGVPPIPVSLATGGPGAQTRIFAYGAGLGVMFSDNLGETWTRADADLGGAIVTLVTTDPGGDDLYAASGRALLRYNRESGTWITATSGLAGGDITSVSFDSENPGILFATTTGGAFKSTNRGSEWVSLAHSLRMLPRFMDSHPTIKTRMIASGVQGAFVSTNRGISWFQAKPAGNTMDFHALTFTPNNAGIIHAATLTRGVLMTEDGGISWEASRYGLGSDSILAVTIDDSEGPAYYAWAPNGDSYRSTNRGLEWSKYLPPWNAGDRILVAADRLQPGSVVALANGTDLYYSATGGSSWVKVLQNGPHQDVLCIHWNARSGLLYAGTRNRGVSLFNLGPLVRESQDN